MTKEQLIASIRVLTDYNGVRLKEIEETLGIPRNGLSGMLNGSRNLTPKWQKLLEVYVQAKAKGKTEIVIPIVASKAPVADQGQKSKKIKVAPASVQVPPSPRTPPTGMTKAQQLRWHREQSQTLQ